MAKTKQTNSKNSLKRMTSKSRMVKQRTSQSRLPVKNHRQIRTSPRVDQNRDYGLFDNVPISLWEEDFSAVKAFIDNLRRQGVKDFRKYFDNNPEAIARCVEMVRIVDVNQVTLTLFEAKNKDELFRGLSQVFGKSTYDVFKEELITFAEGRTRFESEALIRTLEGHENYIHLTMSIVAGFEDKWSRVLLSIIDITERKLAKEKLQDSREYLEKLNDSLQEVIFTVKLPERTIVYVNRSIEHVFGYKPEECIGRNTEFIYPSVMDYHSFGDKLNSTLKKGKDSLHTEHLMKRKIGEIFPAEITVTFIKEKNEITQAISIIRDITTRKQAQEIIRAERQRFYDVLEMLPAYLVLLTQDYHVSFANRFFRERFGESQGRCCFEYLFGRTEPCEICETYTVLKTRMSHEWEWIGPDGRNYHVFDLPFVDTDGSTIILEMGIDVTELKQAEKMLRQSEARLISAQRIAHVGNWDWDIPKDNLFWSDEIYHIFGLTPQQFGATYESFLNSVHPADRESVERSVNEALYEAKPYSINHRIVLPDGTERVVHEEAEVTYGEHGKPVHMIGTVHDITELKRAEYELRALSNELVELQEIERRTVGRELHDQIGQSLTALQLLLAKAAKLPQDDMQASINQAQSVVSELMAQVRKISLDLCPTMLDDLGLLPTLTWHFTRFTKQTGINVNFEHNGLNRNVDPDISLAAYRITQEALTNVARHTSVNEVTVQTWIDKETLYIRIEDKGSGFAPSELTPGISSGLSGMRERALSVGGKFIIESTLNTGTIVEAGFPLSDITGNKKDNNI